MATTNMDFWYDAQIRRYLTQIIRVFSHFQVREYSSSGAVYNRVPAIGGVSSRQVQSIIAKNSENSLPSAPFISVAITDLKHDQDRTQDPFYEDTRQTAEREYDIGTGSYTEAQGNLYTVKRYMPVPMMMEIQTDIWTTNVDSKLQLLEQIAVIFNPDIEIQSNSNPFDWVNVFRVIMKDLQWSSRTIPYGAQDEMDIATMRFEVPIWISPPAKVRKQEIIQRITADIHSVASIDDLGFSKDYADFFGSIAEDARVVVTPGDYHVQLSGNSATLVDVVGTNLSWSNIVQQHGEITTGSLLEFNLSNDENDTDSLITGAIAEHPTNASILVFTIDTDTLPSDTLTDVDRIIDARLNYPGDGTLPANALNQRYMITEDISEVGYINWAVDANENDIIQYNGTSWVVAFDASVNSGSEYVTNSFTGTQYVWTGSMWINSYEGQYRPGYWRLLL